MKQSRTQLKNWYKKGLKPLEGQFADWIDSYWHIDDQIPFSNVSGLPDLSIYEVKESKGLANGYASLDATGKVPLSQLPVITSGWSLTGNAGLVDGTNNILGTTDAVPLIFRVNGENKLTISEISDFHFNAYGSPLNIYLNTTGSLNKSLIFSGGGSNFIQMGGFGLIGNSELKMESNGSNNIVLGHGVSGQTRLTMNGTTAGQINGLKGLNLRTAGADRFNISDTGVITINTAPAVDNSVASILARNASGVLVSRTNIASGSNFSKYASTTVANTTTETSILGTGLGTATIAANELVLGKRYRVFYTVYVNTPNTTLRTLTLRSKIGGAIFNTILQTFTSTGSNVQVAYNFFEFVCTATGTSGTVYSDSQTAQTATVNTTIANALDVTAQWSEAAAGTSVVCNSLSITPLN
jgi:hypothetical protein